MTQQEIFDYVATFLIKQGKPAMDGYRCMYRAPDGSKCAGGCLIPDEVYHPSMEGSAFYCIVDDTFPIHLQENKNFIGDLQYCHDEYSSQEAPGEFIPWIKKRLERFAKARSLSTNSLL